MRITQYHLCGVVWCLPYNKYSVNIICHSFLCLFWSFSGFGSLMFVFYVYCLYFVMFSLSFCILGKFVKVEGPVNWARGRGRMYKVWEQWRRNWVSEPSLWQLFPSLTLPRVCWKCKYWSWVFCNQVSIWPDNHYHYTLHQVWHHTCSSIQHNHVEPFTSILSLTPSHLYYRVKEHQRIQEDFSIRNIIN